MAAMKDSDSNEGAASVKSARRVLSIFLYFEKVRVPRTLSEISQDLGYPISSTLALLRSIQALGYLTYSIESKSYFPTLRFSMLGQWIPERLFAGGGVVKMMESLAAATRETVLLAVQNGLYSQQIHIVETTQSLSYRPPNGTLRPLLRSVAGKVLLCQQSEPQVLKVVERVNASGTESHRFEATEILKELAQVRREGYAYAPSVFTPGVASLSVALPVVEGDLPMVISVAGPSSRVNRTAIPKLLQYIHAALDEMRPSDPAGASDEPIWQN
jgi:DNA-binding IclR family transcriptional regulator